MVMLATREESMSAVLDAPPPPCPAAALPPVDGLKLLSLLRDSLCYSVVVDYLDGKTLIPLGVLVACEAHHFGRALFYPGNLPATLRARSRRWKRVQLLMRELLARPPNSLARLQEEISCHEAIYPPRQRVLRFREIQASYMNPSVFSVKLYAQEVLMKATDMLDETKEAIETEIELLTCSKCGQEHRGPCKPTTHRQIMKHLNSFDDEDCVFWLNRVSEELPVTRQQLTVQLMCRMAILLSRGNSEKAAMLESFFGLAQDILES